MNNKILFTREKIFHTKDQFELIELQTEVLTSLELLEFKYEIKRTFQHETQLPVWIITVYE
ncbi:hypothetical protein M5X17_31325 [Paenibacillus alvei]|uniref:hypothetical protein n=1 Tax=Paenibacillus alvei TaxID=44250 RepID=UPI002282EC47|nr:hypothetical protein [Paenibacillus alvei]MCY9738186.1 hypothetical protein [Paenibacillus alvei]